MDKASPRHDCIGGSVSGWGRVRRVAFFVWAAILSLLFGITFAGVTALTVGLWLVNRNPATNPVTDLGFFALGAVIVTTGFVVQLRAPKHRIAGVQQAVIGLLALGIAGLIGRRVEPLTGSLIFLVATAILVALHPARREFFEVHPRIGVARVAGAYRSAGPGRGSACRRLGRPVRRGSGVGGAQHLGAARLGSASAVMSAIPLRSDIRRAFGRFPAVHALVDGIGSAVIPIRLVVSTARLSVHSLVAYQTLVARRLFQLGRGASKGAP